MSTTKGPSYGVDSTDYPFFSASSSDERLPEEKLLMAVVERAVRDYLGGPVVEQEEAEEWIFGEQEIQEERVEPFTFSWICHQLSLEIESVRARIKGVFQLSKVGALPFYVDKRFLRPPELRSAARNSISMPSNPMPSKLCAEVVNCACG